MAIIREELAVIHPLNANWYNNSVAAVDMLRLDQVHPVVSGNKWYKLKHNIQYAAENQLETVLTFGGAYSNHLVAAAAAAKQYGMKSIGLIRGNYAEHMYTPTLTACIMYGMQLVFISREDYNKRDDATFLQQVSAQFHDPFIIPMGGANDMGRDGAGEIARLVPPHYTHVCISVGTGTSMVGLRNELPASTNVLGFIPMKGGTYLQDEICTYLKPGQDANWQLFDLWHFGGFGKWTDEQLAFMNSFYEMNEIPLDMVYTAKMMFGVHEMITTGHFPQDARILCIHTGGLQGNVAIQEQLVY